MFLNRRIFFACLAVLLIAAHLAYSGNLWEGDVLPAAAALQLRRGAVLYRDIWFDKPPLVAATYLLWGAKTGTVLRFAGAVYAWLACLLAWSVATTAWSRREGYFAAAFMAFFLTFDTHSGIMPLAADMLLLVPHLAAILFAFRKQPLWSGVAAGVGFLFNAKAVFVLAAAALFSWPEIMPLLIGFAIPNALALLWMFTDGALPGYIDQVWRWSSLYAASPVVADPLRNGVIRTLNWLGFHAVLLIGSVIVWRQKPNWRFAVWACLGLAGVTAGWRFFPRYFILLLPVVVVTAARGMAELRESRRRLAVVALATMAVPLIRFGVPYFNVARTADLAMDRDSRESAQLVARTGARTLYVWGYRPELYVYTGLKPAVRWLDSQALTGVPADRHLIQSDTVTIIGTAEARAELARSNPDVVIDGLGLYNPSLSMDRYPELRDWIAGYSETGRTHGTVIYTRR